MHVTLFLNLNHSVRLHACRFPLQILNNNKKKLYQNNKKKPTHQVQSNCHMVSKKNNFGNIEKLLAIKTI